MSCPEEGKERTFWKMETASVRALLREAWGCREGCFVWSESLRWTEAGKRQAGTGLQGHRSESSFPLKAAKRSHEPWPGLEQRVSPNA